MDNAQQNATDSKARLGLWDTIFLIVGIIIGVGIYETSPAIFAATRNAWWTLLLWVAGGFLCLIGAFCFAELASTYPRSGGEYVYLTRAFGPTTGFLFAWAQLAIIRAGGSIGAVAFVFAGYTGSVMGWGRDQSWLNCLFAVAVVSVLTVINILGVRMGKQTQNLLTLLKVLSIGAILFAGFFFGRGLEAPAGSTYEGHVIRRDHQAVVVRDAAGHNTTIFTGSKTVYRIDGSVTKGKQKPYTIGDVEPGMYVKVVTEPNNLHTAAKMYGQTSLWGGLALGLIMVLWTYAGWHEAAYVAAEVRDKQRVVPLALIMGTGLVLLLYLAINLAYWVGLGFDRAGESEAIAADVLQLVFGSWGQVAMALLVMLSCLGALNGMIFTSARIYAEMGEDHPLFKPLSRWHSQWGTPVVALAVQGLLTVAFILFVGIFFHGKDGFDTLVTSTAAVFWIFFLLTGIALFVLRWKEPARERPFRVPLYPLTPLLFCLCCLGMIIASVQYDWLRSLIGVGILAAGVPLFLFSRKMYGRRRQDNRR